MQLWEATPEQITHLLQPSALLRRDHEPDLDIDVVQELSLPSQTQSPPFFESGRDLLSKTYVLTTKGPKTPASPTRSKGHKVLLKVYPDTNPFSHPATALEIKTNIDDRELMMDMVQHAIENGLGATDWLEGSCEQVQTPRVLGFAYHRTGNPMHKESLDKSGILGFTLTEFPQSGVLYQGFAGERGMESAKQYKLTTGLANSLYEMRSTRKEQVQGFALPTKYASASSSRPKQFGPRSRFDLVVRTLDRKATRGLLVLPRSASTSTSSSSTSPSASAFLSPECPARSSSLLSLNPSRSPSPPHHLSPSCALSVENLDYQKKAEGTPLSDSNNSSNFSSSSSSSRTLVPPSTLSDQESNQSLNGQSTTPPSGTTTSLLSPPLTRHPSSSAISSPLRNEVVATNDVESVHAEEGHSNGPDKPGRHPNRVVSLNSNIKTALEECERLMREDSHDKTRIHTIASVAALRVDTDIATSALIKSQHVSPIHLEEPKVKPMPVTTKQGSRSPAKPTTVEEDTTESEDQDGSLFEGDPTIYCSHCAHQSPRRGMSVGCLVYRPSSTADGRVSAALSCATTSSSSMASKSKNLLQHFAQKDPKNPSAVWTESTIAWPTTFVDPICDNGVCESIAAFEQARLFNALTALAYLDAAPGSACRFPKELINLLPRILCLAFDELLFSGSNLAIPPRRKPQSLIIQGEDAGLLSMIDFDQAGFLPSYAESVQGPFTATTHGYASFWSTRKSPQSSSASSSSVSSIVKERRGGIKRLFPSSKSSSTAASSSGVGYRTMRGKHPCPYPVVNYYPTKRTTQVMDYAEPDDDGSTRLAQSLKPKQQDRAQSSVMTTQEDNKSKTSYRNSTFSINSSLSVGSGSGVPLTKTIMRSSSLGPQRGALLLRTTLKDLSGWTRFLSSYHALDRNHRSKGTSHTNVSTSTELFEANDLHKHRGTVDALVGISKTLQHLVVALESGATVLTSEQALDVIESKRQIWLTERQEPLTAAALATGRGAAAADSENQVPSQLLPTASASTPQLLLSTAADDAVGCDTGEMTPSKPKFFKTLLQKMKKPKTDPFLLSSSSSPSLTKEPPTLGTKPTAMATTAAYRPVRTSEDNIYYTAPGVQRAPLVCELPDHVAYGTYSGGPCSPGSPPPVEGNGGGGSGGGPLSPRIIDSRMLGTMAAPDLPAFGIRLTNQEGTLTLAQVERQRLEKEEAAFWNGIEGHCDGVRLGPGGSKKGHIKSAGVALMDVLDLERNLELVEKYVAKIEGQALKHYESAKKC
ncbi:hypothetical protein BGZ75_001175 [Mortierella antarctica]|nr:hypothetical protein BGZ75_001175 [Mortierella antarctica]